MCGVWPRLRSAVFGRWMLTGSTSQAILTRPRGLAIDAAHDDRLMATIHAHGYTVGADTLTERLHYTTGAWVNIMFTSSNVLTLPPPARSDLRSRLEHRIGTTGSRRRKCRHRANLHGACNASSVRGITDVGMRLTIGVWALRERSHQCRCFLRRIPFCR